MTEEPGGSLAVGPAEDLESPGGKAKLAPGASGMPSPHPQVAQPFPQKHACCSLTWGWAWLRCQVHRPFLGETRSMGPPLPPLWLLPPEGRGEGGLAVRLPHRTRLLSLLPCDLGKSPFAPAPGEP